MKRRLHLVTAALVTTAIVMGSTATVAGAADDSPTPKQWANSICSDVDTWITSVQDTISGLKSADSLEAAASDASDGIKSATDQLTSDLSDLGRPTTKNAKQAKKALSELQTQLEQNMASIEDALSDPGTTTVEVASTFAIIGTQLQASVDDVQAAGDTLKGLGANKEIQKAFQSASACKALKKEI